MLLKGKLVTLRPLEYEDLELVRNLINDPWYEHRIVGWSFAVSKKEQEEWFKSFHNSERAIRYIIETTQDGPVGFTGLINIDWKNGSADTAGIRIMQKNNMSKGIATDAYMTLLRYAFFELRLNRINGSVLPHNTASRKLASKVGFKEEGMQRQVIYKDGQYLDLILLGVTKNDYLHILETTKYWE